MHRSALCLSSLLSVMLASMTGCAHQDQVSELHVAMTTEEIQEKFGEPEAARAALREEDGARVEIWQYTLWQGGRFEGWRRYWLGFQDGKLVRWRKANDWSDPLLIPLEAAAKRLAEQKARAKEATAPNPGVWNGDDR